MKKHIKKCIKILIFCVLCLGIFSACGAEIEEKPKGGLNVVTVGFPQYDLARAVCKNTANIKMLIRPGAGIHSFEPSLSDIVAIEEADVFIYNGGESDAWAERILLSLKNKDIKISSIARDTYVDIPGYSTEKLTHAYAYEGIDLLKEVFIVNFDLIF